MNKIFLVISICLLFSFTLLSKYEDRAFIRSMDFAITVKLQDRIDKSVHLRLASLVDNVMEGSSFFAAPVFTGIVVLLITGLVLKKKKWKAMLIPTAFIIIVLVELFGKSIIHHPSPPFSMIKHTTSIFPANYINEQFSYPSGHSARAIFIAIALFSTIQQYAKITMRKRQLLVFILGLYVVLVAVGKLYLGHHWLSDVIGGGLLGGGFGLLTAAVISPIITSTMSD
jgi:membrane-associated phospholipid phosphatase